MEAAREPSVKRALVGRASGGGKIEAVRKEGGAVQVSGRAAAAAAGREVDRGGLTGKLRLCRASSVRWAVTARSTLRIGGAHSRASGEDVGERRDKMAFLR